ncbi:MAG TPA: C40 family peptidase [Bacteroidales bacterium]|nr:C40 family peptidase [Lentimicrobiaceae bacterium]HOI00483.1 C40 family peptidase [Bacteroidales bacterium]
MMYGICTLSVAAVRKEPSDRSEMVTQVLFGELLWILERQNNWLFVRLAWDDYEGWMDIKQVTQVGEDYFRFFNTRRNEVVSDLSAELYDDRERRHLLIPGGSAMPGIKGRLLEINERKYVLNGDTNRLILVEKNNIRQNLVNIALKYLEVPYLWGGRTAFGIDCSGLVQMVYKICGIRLRRDAEQQSMDGHALSFLEEARPGDLAFFDDAQGRIIHVGMLIDKGRILHASGKVRIDTIDHQGIYNQTFQKYTHQLRLIKSYLPG